VSKLNLYREFIQAIEQKDAKRIEQLLHQDNPPPSEAERKEWEDSESVIHHAVKSGDLEIVKLFVEAGFDVNEAAPTSLTGPLGFTPYDAAIKYEMYTIARYLSDNNGKPGHLLYGDELSWAANSQEAHSSVAPQNNIESETLKIQTETPPTLKFIPGELRVLSGDQEGHAFKLAGAPEPEGIVVNIGREADAGVNHLSQIVLDDPYRLISRKQARIINKGKKIWIENLSEVNYTQVDGVELQPGETAVLHHGAKIGMGPWELEYYAPELAVQTKDKAPKVKKAPAKKKRPKPVDKATKDQIKTVVETLRHYTSAIAWRDAPTEQDVSGDFDYWNDYGGLKEDEEKQIYVLQSGTQVIITRSEGKISSIQFPDGLLITSSCSEGSKK